MGDIVITPASNDVNSTAGTLVLRSSDLNPISLRTNDTNRLFIDPTGSVGLGTAVPTGGLHINYAPGAFSEALRLQRNGGIFYSFGLDTNFLNIAYNGNVNANNVLVLTSNGYLGVGNLQNALFNLDVASAYAKGIQLRFDATTGYRAQIIPYWNTNTDTRIDFAINRVQNVTPAVMMSVGYDNNVGIGTTNPTAKLDVVGTIRPSSNLLSHKTASYTTSYPGISSFGADTTDSNITYYDTGKTLPNTNFRGVVWTGKHYIFTDHITPRAFFYDNNFVQIPNAYGNYTVTLPLPSGYSAPHGAAWDGRYLWVVVYTGSATKIVGYDLDTNPATIIAESAAIGAIGATYDIEYADGHLYLVANGTLFIYKWNGSSIDAVSNYPGAAGTIYAQAITYDGSYLWVTSNGAAIYKVGLDGTPLATISSGFPPNTCGWAWNGSNIVSFDYNNRNIFIINTTRLRIDTQKLALMGGNVGVGYTNPSYKLQVNGEIYASSFIYSPYFGVIAGTYNDLNAGDIALNSMHKGESHNYDVFQFNAPNTYETQATSGGAWTSGTVNNDIFLGDSTGPSTLTINNGTFAVRFTWNSIGYRYFNCLYIMNSTQNNYYTVTIEHSANGTTWTTVGTTGGFSGWPSHSRYINLWNNNTTQAYLRLTLTPTWTNANNIFIYNIRYFCSYYLNGARRLFTWDYSRNTFFPGQLYVDGNVGIGTTSAIQKLHIVGSTLITNNNYHYGYTVAGAQSNLIGISSADNIMVGQNNVNHANTIIYGGLGVIDLNTSGSTRMRVTYDGNVGIGTTSATHKLDVRGDVVVKGGAAQHSVIRFRRSDSTTDFGYIGFENPALANDTFLISSAGNGNPLKLKAGTSDEITFFGDTKEYGRFHTNGYLGIGTNTPTTLLSVGGPGSTSAASGITLGGDSVANLYRISSSRIKTDGSLTIDGGGGNAQALVVNRSSTSNENGISFSTAGTVDWYYFVDNATTNLQIQRNTELDSAPRVRFNGANSDILFNLGGGNIGVGTSIPTGKVHIVSSIAGETVLRADGTNGTLLSVVDDLTDSLFSVNNSAGLPVLEVFADDRVVAGQYGSGDFILTSNKVGIGTTNPASKLDVFGSISIRNTAVLQSATDVFAGGLSYDIYGNIRVLRSLSSQGDGMYIGYAGAGGPLRFFSNAGTTEFMTIATNGNVGINTTSPAGLLQAYSTSGRHITYVPGSVSGLVIQKNASIASQGTTVLTLANAQGMESLVDRGTSLNLDIGYGGSNSVGGTIARGARIAALNHNAYDATAANQNAYLCFYTATGGTLTEKVRIQADGKVGIGITNPSAAKLQIGAAGNDAVSVILTPGYERVRYYGFDLLGYNDGNLWMIGNNNTNTLLLSKSWDWDNQVGISYTPGTIGAAGGVLQIGQTTKNSTTFTHGITKFFTSGTERLTILANGKVGISTPSPAYELDIVGSSRVSSQSFVGLYKYEVGLDNLTASAAQARRFEIARLFIDSANWNYGGVVTIELRGLYYNSGVYKKYIVNYGYGITSGRLDLVDCQGNGDNRFQVRIFAPVLVTGNFYYLPVYVEVDYYTFVTVTITSNRERTTNSTNGNNGTIYINQSPSPVNIPYTGITEIQAISPYIGNNTIAGNLGIGVNPSYKLDVNGNINVNSTIYFNNPGIYIEKSNTYDFVVAQNAESANGLYLAGAGNVYLSIDANDNETDRAFIIQNNAVKGGNELFRFQENGRVGIGTNNPSSKVHIFNTGLADNSVNALLTIDGKFTAAGVNSDDIVGIAFRVENSAGGSQSSVCIGSSYQGGGYNALLLQHQGGNVGVSTNNPSFKFDNYNDTIRTLSRVAEKIIAVSFPHNVANQKVDIIFDVAPGTNVFWGNLEVEITDGYNNQLATGKLIKVFALGLNPATGSGPYGSAIFDNTSYYTAAYGAVADNYAIDGIFFNTTTGKYYLTIIHRTSTGNTPIIKIKGFTVDPAVNAVNINNLAAGAVYTTNTTVYFKPVVETLQSRVGYNGNINQSADLIVQGNVGIGSSAPASKVDINGAALTATSKGTYALAVGNNGNTDLTFAADGSYAYIQSWGSKPLYINNQGNNVLVNSNVGIGNVTPNAARLHIKGDGSNPVLRVETALLVAGTTTSSKTFVGWMPIQTGAANPGDTVFIPLFK